MGPRPSTGPSRPGFGGRTGPTTREAWWQTWWDLNRWIHFPDRGGRFRGPDHVVTPREAGSEALDPVAIAAARRALVAGSHIVPFLLELADPAAAQRPEVRAAALLALAKLCNDAPVVELLFRWAGDRGADRVVRESAAMALGLLRRTDAALQMEGRALDAVRGRLLDFIDQDDVQERVRAFGALALGLLGDQPFGSAFTKDGRIVTRAIWERVLVKRAAHDLGAALLTALGMQPAAGTADRIERDLMRVVHGRRIGRRAWSAEERSNALVALLAQEGAGWPRSLARAVADRRAPADVRRAAFIELGARARTLTSAERIDLAEAADVGLRHAHDPLTRGLAEIALGRLLGADLAEGSAVLLERTDVAEHLLQEALHGSRPHRGFSALALALSLVDLRTDADSASRYRERVVETLARGFERTAAADLRAAYAVALGLLGPAAMASRKGLEEVLVDRHADPDLRGHAALALAQLTGGDAACLRALRTALWDKRSIALRSQAALALSFAGGTTDTRLLVHELRTTSSQWVLAQIASALGRLGDLVAVSDVMALAREDDREDEARAVAIAALGLIADPEPKPSILLLTHDANYPAAPPALLEAYGFL